MYFGDASLERLDLPRVERATGSNRNAWPKNQREWFVNPSLELKLGITSFLMIS